MALVAAATAVAADLLGAGATRAVMTVPADAVLAFWTSYGVQSVEVAVTAGTPELLAGSPLQGLLVFDPWLVKMLSN